MKILMIIAQRDFRDEEFQEPYEIFKENDIVVDVASKEAGDCIGSKGAQVVADRALRDVEVPQYFAIVLVGGPGAPGYIGDSEIIRILDDAMKQDIVISAICIAPLILSKGGYLDGRRATVWNGDGNQAAILENGGATYVDEPVVVDGRLVTGNGPDAARKFGETVLKVAECEDCWKRPGPA